jgi:ubiquinone/menaquinone biosynthesis C-methylase UbiE
MDYENAEKQYYFDQLDPQMFGRVMNDIQSYDYIDNEKYKRIEKLLEIMSENFGFEMETPDERFKTFKSSHT